MAEVPQAPCQPLQAAMTPQGPTSPFGPRDFRLHMLMVEGVQGLGEPFETTKKQVLDHMIISLPIVHETLKNISLHIGGIITSLGN